MGSWRIDTTAWPVALHTVEGTLSDEEIDAYVAEATTQLMRGERHVTIMDARNFGRVSAYTRARSMHWQRDHRQQLATFCAGAAYVLSSPLMRFMAMNLLFLVRPPTPYLICGTVEEALDWARERLGTD